jgi:hypothetical protein
VLWIFLGRSTALNKLEGDRAARVGLLQRRQVLLDMGEALVERVGLLLTQLFERSVDLVVTSRTFPVFRYRV